MELGSSKVLLEISPNVATDSVSFTRTTGAACSWFNVISVGVTRGYDFAEGGGL